MASVLHSLKEIVSFIGVIFLLLIYIIILFVLGYSIPYVYPFHNNSLFLIPFYLAIPFPVSIFFLRDTAAYVWYLILSLTVFTSSAYLFYRGIIPYFRNFFKKPFGYRHNSFQDITELFSLSMFFTMLIYYITILFGAKPATIGIEKYPLWFQMLQLLHAAVYEELIVRILFLGVPLFLVYKLKGDKISPLRIFGGGFKIGRWEMAFLLLSSVIFGLAHMTSWGIWKVIPTLVAGLALGYLFLRYGIFASIAFHFINDYLSIPMSLFPELVIPIGLITLYFLAAGLVFFISYSIRIYHYFFPPHKVEKEVPPPPQPPWIKQTWIDLHCPACGGDVFQYVDKNHLRCLKCGTIIDISSYPEQSNQSEKEDHLP